ncbi:MAG TPA: hypothetical protein VFS37_05935, partial [Conexibacter sp.]|nr:hypothetical protein [Conexibacter sp.]
EQELEATRAELADERERSAALVVGLDGLTREAAQQRELLTSIYDGGWWRLRDRLMGLPAVPRLARAAGRLSRRAD